MTTSIEFPCGAPSILAAAVVLDLVLGDPSNRIHPVAAMGWLIDSLRKRMASRGRLRPLFAGLCIVVLGLILTISAGALVLLLRDRHPRVCLVTEVVLLKLTFSIRALSRAASDVRCALVKGDLAEARRLVSWHLVSRDVSGLDEARVAAATIESVAENASDGIIAPWLFYLAGGLPAALAYRLVNTADAMLGYRDAEREWLGKIPARLDDVLNWLPARITAVLVIFAAPLAGGYPIRGFKVWWKDAGKTPSPNAGHPMAAAAGVLGVELEKVGCYRLGAGERLPGEVDIKRAIRLLYVVAGIALAASVGFLELPRFLGW
jgi:adenosylcobinamide-phosphate synthase